MHIVYAALIVPACVLFGLLMGFDWKRYQQAQNGNLPSDLTPHDLWRKEMKEKGLVIHLPSYRIGVEAYIEPSAQYAEVDPRWPRKFGTYTDAYTVR